ncbi:MAG TPA: GNAT family N-acetyltransferase [Opitutus sp.]|nr:GNAT family N-acetyltransferase [Opitutus sp.]
MQSLLIRRYEPADLPALYHICHATGLNGGDASSEVSDPQLIGHIYAAPYAVLEPESASVVVLDDTVVGYLLATVDSARFHERSEQAWFPALRARYPVPPAADSSTVAMFIRALHRGHPPPADSIMRAYPAHLHIDLLPVAQGLGAGRRLMDRLFAQLRGQRLPGVHLYVARANQPAIAFYERIGFTRIDENDGAIGYGYALT